MIASFANEVGELPKSKKATFKSGFFVIFSPQFLLNISPLLALHPLFLL